MQSLIDSFQLISCSDSHSLPSSSSSPVSLSPYDSEDEVVWSLSSSSASAVEYGDDDEDFVLLHNPPIRKTIRRWSDQFDAQESASTPTKSCNTNDTEGDNIVSRFTHVDRTASVTPIPTSIRRTPVTQGIRPPPAESTFVSATTQDANDQRKPVEQAARRKKRGKEFKKEAKAAAAKTTRSEDVDDEQTKKGRKRAARRRRKERMRLRKQQAEVVTPVTKETPTKAKVVTTPTSPEMYKEASLFITSFLAHPVAKRDSVCRLTLLQSLIVELGFMSTALPTTLRAARSFVKTHVFLNIKEYIANREQGQAATQRLLFPSRNALIKDIRRKGKPASLKWVKQQGLDVLLVSCYNH